MAAAVNGGLHMMPSSFTDGFFPDTPAHHHVHSRSASVSSASSSASRPQSAHGGLLGGSSGGAMVPTMGGGGVGDGSVYRSAYGRFLPHHAQGPHAHSTSTGTHHLSHHRDDSSSAASSAFSTDLSSPADSPPTHPAHALAHPSLAPGGAVGAGAHGLPPASFGGKTHLARAHPTRIRSVREAASPYPRDAESVYSSSSETEDVASLYFGGGGGGGGGSGHPSPPDYTTMYVSPATQPDAFGAAAGQFGRMTLGPDHALETLASSVRAATTTSAADRAKQIFVQAW